MPVCPLCHSSRYTSSLYEAIAAGTSTEWEEVPSGYRDMSGNMQYGMAKVQVTKVTALAAALEKPARPMRLSGWGCGSVFWLLLCLAWLTISASFFIGMFSMARSQNIPFDIEWLMGPYWNSWPLGEQLAGIGVVIFYLSSSAFAIISSIRIFRKRAAESREYADTLGRWSKAIERWNKLWYCSLHEGVFSSDDPEFIPVHRMRNYIYRS